MEWMKSFWSLRDAAPVTYQGIVWGAFLVAVIGVFFLARLVILPLLLLFIRNSKTRWDDLLVKRSVVQRLAWLAPAMVIYIFLPLLAREHESVVEFVTRLVTAYTQIIIIWVIHAVIDVFHDGYNSFTIAKRRPIKGYLQLVKLFITGVGIIFVVTGIMDRSPWKVVTGLGAATAVLALLFKDTIFGLVASIQLSTNNMVNIGDWIDMPKYGADGSVIDITLHTVKIQNWDKTISTIPAYALISDSFRNWRGMQEAGGRRIKRALYIDMQSIRFLDTAMLRHIRKIMLLQDYLAVKEKEIVAYNSESRVSRGDKLNGRHLTNIGTFRAYISAYLRQHPKVHDELTFLVRQLQPTDKGLPLEIYVFSRDIAWSDYEALQADIFDHLMAVVPEFGLALYQMPSSNDVRLLKRNR